MRSQVRFGRIVAVTCILGAAACADAPITETIAPPPPAAVPTGALDAVIETECRADVATGEVTCGRSVLHGASPLDISANTTYEMSLSGTVDCSAGTRCTATMSITSKLSQPIGTTDGITVDSRGVRAFITSVTASGGGTSAVAGPTQPNGRNGSTICCPPNNSNGQRPFFQYNEILHPGQTLGPRAWGFTNTGTVTAIQFTVVIVGKLPEEGNAIRRWVIDPPASGNPTYYGVWGVDTANVWFAASDGQVYRFNPNVSQCQPTGTLHGTCPAVTNGGRPTPPYSAFDQTLPNYSRLNAVWGPRTSGDVPFLASNIYVVGFAHRILRFGSVARSTGVNGSNPPQWSRIDTTGIAALRPPDALTTVWYSTWTDTAQSCFRPNQTTNNPTARTRAFFVGTKGRLVKMQGLTCDDTTGSPAAVRNLLWTEAVVTPSAPQTIFTSVYGLNANGYQDIFAVGTSGFIYRSTDGVTFKREFAGTTRTLYAVWMVDTVVSGNVQRHVYVLGRNNILIRKIIDYPGNTSAGWAAITGLPVSNTFFWGISGSSVSDIYVSTGNGDALHCGVAAGAGCAAGSNWRLHFTGQTNPVLGIWHTASGTNPRMPRLYGGGTNGTLVRGLQ